MKILSIVRAGAAAGSFDFPVERVMAHRVLFPTVFFKEQSPFEKLINFSLRWKLEFEWKSKIDR